MSDAAERPARPPASLDGAIALGWATVELDRAAEELGGLLPPWGAFVDAPPSVALGARCRVAAVASGDPSVGSATRVVLLEPTTEGRIAASLARHGEGWAAGWFAALPGVTAWSAARPGPLGMERLARDGPWAGPHRVWLDGDTIEVMTDPTLTIRGATPDDAESIAALLTDEGYPAGPSDIRERLTRFASPYSQVLVAEREGAVLGFVALHAMPRFEHDDRIVRILALVVDAGARERGVGGALIAEAERAAGELGAAFIEITAGHHRPDARRLYESAGYDATVAAYLRKKL